MRWLLSLIATLSYSVARAETRPLANGFCVHPMSGKECADNPRALDVSIVSESELDDLFQKFRKDESLALAYTMDGCYARASKMAQVAEKRGWTFAKVFAEGNLVVDAPPPRQKWPTYWSWHVAPVVYVKHDNGDVELEVVDPSLFTKPVTLDVWKAKIISGTLPISGHPATPYARPKASIKRVYFGSRFQNYPDWRSRLVIMSDGSRLSGELGDNANAWNERQLANNDRILKVYSTLLTMNPMQMQNYGKLIPNPFPIPNSNDRLESVK